MNSERWTLNGELWTVNVWRWTVNGGRWTVNGGRWTMKVGRWTVTDVDPGTVNGEGRLPGNGTRKWTARNGTVTEWSRNGHGTVTLTGENQKIYFGYISEYTDSYENLTFLIFIFKKVSLNFFCEGHGKSLRGTHSN